MIGIECFRGKGRVNRPQELERELAAPLHKEAEPLHKVTKAIFRVAESFENEERLRNVYKELNYQEREAFAAMETRIREIKTSQVRALDSMEASEDAFRKAILAEDREQVKEAHKELERQREIVIKVIKEGNLEIRSIETDQINIRERAIKND